MIAVEDFILRIAIGGLLATCLLILALLLRAGARNTLLDAERLKAAFRMRRDMVWTLTPVFAFVIVVVPLVRYLHLRDSIPADVTIAVTGRMWSWTYNYPDYRNLSFSAPMLADRASAKAAAPAMSRGYDHIVVPVGKTVRIVTVGTNVIYRWAIPDIDATVEALPGQTTQSWFKADKEGRYYGQCTELCGLPHTFRPIEIEVVSLARFEKWISESRRHLALLDGPSPRARKGR